MNTATKTSDWVTDMVPGYRSKTFTPSPGVTVVVHRPILSDKERTKRESLVEQALTNYVRNTSRRKANEA